MTNKFDVFMNRFSEVGLYATYLSIALVVTGLALGKFTTFGYADQIAGVGLCLFIVTGILMIAAFVAIICFGITHFTKWRKESTLRPTPLDVATDPTIRVLRNTLGMLNHPRSHEVMSPSERAAVEETYLAARKTLEPASLDQDFIAMLTRQGINDITVVASEDGKRLLFSYNDEPRPAAG